MGQYYHAHHIDTAKCDGRMKCMRVCPTQAIRIRNHKAQISDELCVDCGTCLKICPTDSINSKADTFDNFSHFKYKVVIPAAVFYSQFDPLIHPYIIHLALKKIGFDEIVDLTVSSKTLAIALEKYLESYKGRLPLISSHCPAVIRLVQVKYPDLVELLLPLDVPRELTAREVRENFPKKLGLKSEEIGIIYLAPCPAKIVSTKQPAEKSKSYYDGVITIRDIYAQIYPLISEIKEQFDVSQVPGNFTFNTGWARLGSIGKAAQMENWVAVSGLDHIIKSLDDIENSKLRNIDFLEAMTCMLGCIGGPYNVENLYVARTNNVKQKRKYETPIEIDIAEITKKYNEGYYYVENRIQARPTKYFDTDIATSIKRIKERDRIFQKLPQIDCGCCGAPTCLAFAEDFVRGEVELTDCILLR